MTLRLSMVLLLSAHFTHGQYTEVITSSRPGQAFTATAAGKNTFQVQTGFSVKHGKFGQGRSGGLTYSSLFRYGFLERVEFRTQLGISRVKTKPSDQVISGISALGLGTKINLWNGTGRKPKVGLRGDFFLPIVTDGFRAANSGATLILAHSQDLTDKLSLNTNFGASSGWDSLSPTGLFAVNVGFPVVGNLNGFVEAYGNFTRDFLDLLFDGGFSYNINKNTVLDISAGYGSNDGLKQFFIDFGLSWRTRFGVQEF